MDENKEMRDINELVDLPYSEMSNEEIDLLVQWKAENIARDNAYIERMNEIQTHFMEQAEIHRAIADNSNALLNELTAHAIEGYKAVSNNE